MLKESVVIDPLAMVSMLRYGHLNVYNSVVAFLLLLIDFRVSCIQRIRADDLQLVHDFLGQRHHRHWSHAVVSPQLISQTATGARRTRQYRRRGGVFCDHEVLFR